MINLYDENGSFIPPNAASQPQVVSTIKWKTLIVISLSPFQHFINLLERIQFT